MQLIEIGKRRLAAWTSGTGEPSVILETGLGAPASDWEQVHQEVASVTHVCHYDRANCGLSEAAPTPRTARDMAEDLHSLRRTALPETPLVLVGHSFGGLVCLSYANMWRDDVAALVLVDPSHPEQFTTLGPMMPDTFGPMKEFWQTGWLTPGSTAERIDFLQTFEEVRGIENLGSLRMLVLTSSTMQGMGGNDDAQDIWIRFHQEYLQLSTRSEQRVLPGTDHFLQRCAPDAVASAIKDVIAELR